MPESALSLLIFVRTNFAFFHILEKIEKINISKNRELQKLNARNLIRDYVRVQRF